MSTTFSYAAESIPKSFFFFFFPQTELVTSFAKDTYSIFIGPCAVLEIAGTYANGQWSVMSNRHTDGFARQSVQTKDANHEDFDSSG